MSTVFSATCSCGVTVTSASLGSTTPARPTSSDFEQALYRAETPLIPPHYGEASLAMFIARPVAELASSSQQDGKQLNVTQLIRWLDRQPDAGAPRIFLNYINCPFTRYLSQISIDGSSANSALTPKLRIGF